MNVDAVETVAGALMTTAAIVNDVSTELTLMSTTFCPTWPLSLGGSILFLIQLIDLIALSHFSNT